jgi:hypothetical protein
MEDALDENMQPDEQLAGDQSMTDIQRELLAVLHTMDPSNASPWEICK